MEKLSPCIVKIGEITERHHYANGISKTKVINEAKIHKGRFHTWGVEAHTKNGYLAGTVAGQVSILYGLVEYEDGTMHKVNPECIFFYRRSRQRIIAFFS